MIYLHIYIYTYYLTLTYYILKIIKVQIIL